MHASHLDESITPRELMQPGRDTVLYFQHSQELALQFWTCGPASALVGETPLRAVWNALVTCAPSNFQHEMSIASIEVVLVLVQKSTRRCVYVQGNCTQPPPELADVGLSGPAFKWEAPQCVVINDHTIVDVTHRVWLNALLLRARDDIPNTFSFLSVNDGARLYGTRLTLQGNGVGNSSALNVRKDGKAYLEGAAARFPCSRSRITRAKAQNGKASQVLWVPRPEV